MLGRNRKWPQNRSWKDASYLPARLELLSRSSNRFRCQPRQGLIDLSLQQRVVSLGNRMMMTVWMFRLTHQSIVVSIKIIFLMSSSWGQLTLEADVLIRIELIIHLLKLVIGSRLRRKRLSKLHKCIFKKLLLKEGRLFHH